MYDCVIVGGGIAGLQAAIQLGRYGHRTLVVDAGEGRSALCKRYGNVLGWPEGVSGALLRERGRKQAEALGVEFARDRIVRARKLADVDGQGGGFRLYGEERLRDGVEGRAALLATGVMDRLPELPGLKESLGLSVYICPDCDGHEVRGRRTVILGSGDVGAHMALEVAYYTEQLVYVNHGKTMIKEDLREKLAKHGIETVHAAVMEVLLADTVLLECAGQSGRAFRGVRLENGETVEGDRAFLAFGGNEVRTDLATQLGAERMENRHIVTDPRTKMTSVRGLWAAGDIGVHSEQLVIAMAEGHQAAIWMHKHLMQLGGGEVAPAARNVKQEPDWVGGSSLR